MRDKPLKFQIELEDTPLVPVSEVIDKARVRIFYKGKNRNGGFITNEFAENLIKTLPYTPIKGIVDQESGDFQGHGKKSDGKIFGIVPENPNCTWESHEDVDGVVRTYLVADVYLFTGLYESAKLIVGKGQSMELIPESITGEWIDLDSEYFFIYQTGSFLGLQVLGNDVEPAFEGAAFFSLKADELDNLITETYGGIGMDKNKDKVVDKVDVSVYEEQIAQLKEDNKTLANELTSLREFKMSIERGEKEAILNEFSNSLDEDTINSFKDNLDEYSNESLEKELAYKLYLMNKDNVEEPTEVEEDAEEEVEDEADKGKTEFSFYEVEKNEPKGDIEVLLEKYL